MRIKPMKLVVPCILVAVLGGMIAYSRPGDKYPDKTVVRIAFPRLGYQSLERAWNDVIEEFEKANPTIKVVQVESDWNKIALMTAAKMLPDVYGSNSFNVFRERLRAEDLTPYIKRDYDEMQFGDFIPELIGDCAYGGKTYMLPHFYNIALLYYNADIFDEAGVEPPQDDWTWDDYVKAAGKLAKFDENGRQIRWGTNLVWGWWEEWLTYVYMCGGGIFNDNWDRCLLDTPEAIRAFTYYRDLVLKYEVAPRRRKLVLQPFLNQMVAMEWGGHTTNWIGLRSHAQFRWDVALLPAGPKTRTGGERVSATFCLYNHSKHKEEAWKLLKCLTSAQAGEQWCKVGLTPVRTSVANNFFLKRNAQGRYDLDPQHREKAIEAIKYGVNQPIMPDFGEIVLNFFQPMIDRMMLEEMTPEEVARKGTEKTNRFLKMMGRSRQEMEKEKGI